MSQHIRYRQQAGASNQISKTANETAVYAAKSMEKLFEQATELEMIRVQRAFTACRAKRCENFVMTGGATPRNESRVSLLVALERRLGASPWSVALLPFERRTTFRRIAITSGSVMIQQPGVLVSLLGHTGNSTAFCPLTLSRPVLPFYVLSLMETRSLILGFDSLPLKFSG